MTQQGTPVVIDNGSGMCKAGLSGDDAPMVTFSSVVGRPKSNQIMIGIFNQDAIIGDEAKAKGSVLRFNNPIKHGIINDWDDMTKIWRHCFDNELRVISSEHPCLLTEAPRNPKVNREKTTEIMFENFDVPAFYLSSQAVLSLISSGKTTGLVLDAGDDVTHTVPIYEGNALPDAIQGNNLAGRVLTLYMRKLMSELGLSYSSSNETEILRDIKEKHCYVALDFEQQMKKFGQDTQNGKVYELPDGETFSIYSQRFRCPEALFNSKLIEMQIPGLHQITHQSILKCDADIRKDLYNNIILSGGTTMFPGIQERLIKEVKALASQTIEMNVFAPAERKYSTWIGGSILASLPTFENRWITKAQYQEYGPEIVHKKCF